MVRRGFTDVRQVQVVHKVGRKSHPLTRQKREDCMFERLKEETVLTVLLRNP